MYHPTVMLTSLHLSAIPVNYHLPIKLDTTIILSAFLLLSFVGVCSGKDVEKQLAFDKIRITGKKVHTYMQKG